MKQNHKQPVPWLLAGSLLLGGAAWAAQPVTVTNPSFEDNSSNPPVGWSAVNGGAIAFIPSTDQYNPLTKIPDGTNVASVFAGAAGDGISQTLAATLQADNTYTLTVQIGDPADLAFDGYTIQLLADGNVLAQDDNTQTPANGDFTTATATYVYDAGDAALVGQPLEIRLLSKGLVGSSSDVNFDNVQLTVALGNPLAVPGGPYTAFVGGSLILNGSGSLPSDGETISSYEWDLDNDGDFDEAITGATPAAIPQADLVATYGMSLGSNTIKLRVTDSAAKTSTVETTVNIVPGTAVIYEPFAYSATVLNGASGTNEKGFSAPWVANSSTNLAGNLPYGSLLTKGAGIGNLGGGQNRFGGGRAVDASALANNGLLADGATLWFSTIMGYDSGGNRTNSRLVMVLGTESMSGGNFQYYFPTAGATGLGVTVGRFNGVNGRIVATEVRDSTFGGGFGGNVFGTGQSTNVLPSGNNTNVDYKLVVGRITWGATEDTIDLFLPDENMEVDLNTPHSTLTVDVDQSGYDTISFARGDRMVMDEIRFGASYASVTDTGTFWDLNGDVAGAGSTTPSGTWGTDSNWGTKPDGTVATGPWVPGGTAVFSAGNDATGSYTITVDGTQDLAGLTIEDGTVTIGGGTALRLTANGSVSVASGLSASISTPFTEDVAGRELSKSGAGTLVLSGDNSGVTGGLVLSGGATVFESPSAIAGTTRNAAITVAGAAVFGSSFTGTDVATALADRITADSAGTIAVDNQLATDFDFNTPGLNAAYLGAVGNQSYTGTLTPNGTTYRLGGGGGTLTMANTNALTGDNGLNVRGSVVLAADNDYTGPTVVNGGASLSILGATATSGIAVNQPGGFLEIGDEGALGTGTLSINGGFATGPTVSVVGSVVGTNPVALNGNFTLVGSGSLTVGPVTLFQNRIMTNNNSGLTTFASITGTDSSLTLEGNGSLTTGAITTGAGALAKGGSGTLTLTGVNTYTGGTTASAGTLTINGSMADATMSIASGAVVNGTGTLTFNIDGTTADQVVNGGTIDIANLNVAVNATGSGLTEAEYVLVDATGGGTISGTFAGITGAPGYALNYDTPNQVKLVQSAGSAYTTWAATNAPTGNPDDDFDGDGVANAVEFVLGGDKDTNDLGKLPQVGDDGTNMTFTFERDQASIDAAVSVEIEVGTDLAAWPDSYTVGADTLGSDAGVTVSKDDPASGTDTVTLSVTKAPDTKKFGRLKVVVTP
jgi:autotransporter-associated beta strand protein